MNINLLEVSLLLLILWVLDENVNLKLLVICHQYGY